MLSFSFKLVSVLCDVLEKYVVNFFKTADMCVVVWLLWLAVVVVVLVLVLVLLPSCFELANWPKISLLFVDAVDEVDEDGDDSIESVVVITSSIGIGSSASKSRTIAERRLLFGELIRLLFSRSDEWLALFSGTFERCCCCC